MSRTFYQGGILSIQSPNRGSAVRASDADGFPPRSAEAMIGRFQNIFLQILPIGSEAPRESLFVGIHPYADAPDYESTV